MKSPSRRPRRDVPCNGCTLCCQKDAIRLQDEDDPGMYRTETHPYIPGARMIAHKPNGECVYLGADGCTIHDRAPALCRDADCRGIAARLDFDAAHLLHGQRRLDIRVWDRGRQLLEGHEPRPAGPDSR